jgi:hypothetical protein
MDRVEWGKIGKHPWPLRGPDANSSGLQMKNAAQEKICFDDALSD